MIWGALIRTIVERLAESRKRAGLAQVELAVALGERYNHSVISKVEHGRAALRLEGAVKAADYLTGLTDDQRPAADLAARVTELEDAQATPSGTDGRARILPFARPGIRTVPLVQGAGIAAGAGAAADDEYLLSYVPFRDDWLRRHRLNPDRCRVVEVVDDSVEPVLESGAVILVDFQGTTRRRDKIFAVRAEDGPVVKRLRHDERGWWLVSENRAYALRPWPADAPVLGQVMWTGRTL